MTLAKDAVAAYRSGKVKALFGINFFAFGHAVLSSQDIAQCSLKHRKLSSEQFYASVDHTVGMTWQ